MTTICLGNGKTQLPSYIVKSFSLIVIQQIKNVFDSHFILEYLKDTFCHQSVCFMPLGQIIYWRTCVHHFI